MKIPWLSQLEKEDSPILNSLETNLVEDIYSATDKEIKRGYLEFLDDTTVISNKISVVEENLHVIVDKLKISQATREHFINEYPAWEEIRKSNIESLENIGKTLHSIRKNCNISRLVGNFTSLIGGSICVASAVLTPVTLGLTTPLAIAGGTITFVGSATSIGTTVAEIAKLRNKLQEANCILKRDKESFEALKSWLAHAAELSSAFESLQSIYEDDSLKGILRIIREFAEIIYSSRSHEDKKEKINILVKSTIPNLPRELIHSTLTANLVSLLLIIALLQKRNHTVFENATKTLKIVSNVVSLIDFSVDIFQSASTFVKSDIAITANVSKAFTKGAIALFGVTLDVASIVLTSIDVHKGSVSGEGGKIIDISSKLKEEANILRKVFHELNVD